MMGGEAHIGKRVEHPRSREPSFSQPVYAGPGGPVLLASSTECPSPEPSHPLAKYTQPLHVSRYRVVVEVALDDRLEPFARLPDRIVHASAELLLNFLQFG